MPYMGREAKFKHGLRKDKRMAQLTIQHGWTQEEQKLAENLVGTSLLLPVCSR
jgi:hypothetical protein